MTDPTDPATRRILGQIPPFDTGNQLLAPGPAMWTTAQVDTPAGPRLAVTFRTTSATLTLFLERGAAEQVSRDIAAAAAQMSSLIVAPASALNGHGLGEQ